VKSKAIFAAVVFIAVALPVQAQSDDPNSISLGDLARELRQKKEAAKTPAPPPPVIDNDNLTAVMNDVASHRPSHSLTFSFDGLGKKFQVSSSPDVTCSLSFNANASALLTDPYASRDLPPEELAKLDGPATINGDTLEVDVHNGTAWSLKEITVGLTLLRRSGADDAYIGPAKLITAAATDIPSAAPALTEKHSDVTVLYHIKGAAAPASTTVFRESLGVPIAADQEWHWAIVEAKGYPPAPAPPAQAGTLPPSQPLLGPNLSQQQNQPQPQPLPAVPAPAN
jgi:hypothetical protein